MKKPLFNQIERMIMIEDNSFYASKMKLQIATKKCEREFSKAIYHFLEKINSFLSKIQSPT